MFALWNEFDASLIKVSDVHLGVKKIAGVRVPLLENVDFEIRPYSLFNAPKWYADGHAFAQGHWHIRPSSGSLLVAKLNLLEHARKKTTQKVNLFEKVQIPGYQDALRKDQAVYGRRGEPLQVIAENHEIPSREKEGGRSMITKMKKLTFLVYHKEYEAFLTRSARTGRGARCGKAVRRDGRHLAAIHAEAYALQEYASEHAHPGGQTAGRKGA